MTPSILMEGLSCRLRYRLAGQPHERGLAADTVCHPLPAVAGGGGLYGTYPVPAPAPGAARSEQLRLALPGHRARRVGVLPPLPLLAPAQPRPRLRPTAALLQPVRHAAVPQLIANNGLPCCTLASTL